MLNIFTVAFFGHRYIDNLMTVQELLEKQVIKLIDEKEYVDFLVGRHGDFDRCASSAVAHIQKHHRDDNSALVLVLPYETAEYKQNKEYFEKYYTDIEISQKAALSHRKAAIQVRNREMVDRSDLVICYVTEEYGGAYSAIKYAQKIGKKIINIAKTEDC